MPKQKQNINHWLQTFGRPEGHKVLKEILTMCEELEYFNEFSPTSHGRKQVSRFILDRLKAASGKKETYASIIYEVELL